MTTLATWPVWIRIAAMQDGFGEAMEMNVAEFKPEIGPPIRRRRSSLSQNLIGFKNWFSSQEWSDIQSFFRGTLADGTLRFTMNHPRTGTAATWLFVEPPKLNQVFGLNYEIWFSLRLMAGGASAPSLKFNRPPNSQYLGAL